MSKYISSTTYEEIRHLKSLNEKGIHNKKAKSLFPIVKNIITTDKQVNIKSLINKLQQM